MILNKSQAEAVYRAMCELNDIGARIDAFLENSFHAREMAAGRVVIHAVPNLCTMAEPEVYPNQADFADAYGLLG